MASTENDRRNGTDSGINQEEQDQKVNLSNRLGTVTRKLNQIKILLRDDENFDSVVEEFAELNDRVKGFKSAVNNELTKSNLGQLERLNLENWYKEKVRVMESSRNDISIWIKRVQTQGLDALDSASRAGSHVSRTSSRSSTTSSKLKILSQERMRLAKERAKLIAQEELDREMEAIEEQRALVEKKAKAVKRRSEYTRLAKMEEALNEYDEEMGDDARSQCSARLQKTIFKEHPASYNRKEINLLAEMVQRSHLPKSEPEIFDGSDVTLFANFLQAFDRMIACHTDSSSDLIYYLEKYTRDEPRELVRSCFYLSPNEGYAQARKLLTKEYGNEFQVAATYLRKVENWTVIAPDDGRALKKFAIFLRGCQNYLRTISALSQLNNPAQIQMIVKKLPLKVRERWRNRAFHLIEEKGFVRFEDLADFVSRQAEILCLPVFGDIGGSDFEKKTSGFPIKKSLSMATEAETNGLDQTKSCLLCKKENHALGNCFFFAKKPEEEKIRYIHESRLCFGCLDVGHVSKDCRKRSKCKTCGFNHPTSLHRGDNQNPRRLAADESKGSNSRIYGTDEPRACKSACSIGLSNFCDPTGTNVLATDTNAKIGLAIIPVRVRIKGQSTSVITYAGLDNFSSDCFATEELLSELGIEGNKAEICLSTMNCKNQRTSTKAVNNLEVLDLDENQRICLPVIFSRKDFPVSRSDLLRREQVDALDFLADIPFVFVEANVGLMLGANVPEVIKPLQIVSGPVSGPYASRHLLGWALNGPLSNIRKKSQVQACSTNSNLFQDIDNKIRQMFAMEFNDTNCDGRAPSVEDRQWQNRVEESIKKNEEGFYEIALPFRDDVVHFPNNRAQALQRIESLKRKLIRDEGYRREYGQFMHDMFQTDFAEMVPKSELIPAEGQVWYIVHHGVYHKQKDKLRVVFDCSLKYSGVSLNDKLLQGPDLTNSLLGVLLRFREKRVAIMGDIEKMFYQVKVPKRDSDFLRFFWFENGDLNAQPTEFRLKVHVFGAISSPSCANFALRKSAIDSKTEISEEALRTVHDSFYVDDLLKSVDEPEQAVALLSDVKVACSRGNFNLTKISSNDQMVLSAFKKTGLDSGAQELNPEDGALLTERALGVVWNVRSDTFGFKIKEQIRPTSRRGLLSSIYSIYDPFGFIGPAILPAKRMLQELCRRGCAWDEEIPEDLKTVWMQWKSELILLRTFEISRWIHETSDCVTSQLHVFSDGSEVGYGAICYIRVETRSGIQCTLMLAKSRLAPLKRISIPRLELAGAKLGVELATIIQREKCRPIEEVHFWTDSETVLKYLKNEKRRFQRFVANRVTYIRDRSELEQWHHVPGSLNPADAASRGLPIRELVVSNSWKDGPSFLRQSPEFWPKPKLIPDITDDDIEVVSHPIISVSTGVKTDLLSEWFKSVSDWQRLKQMMAGLVVLQRKSRGIKSSLVEPTLALASGEICVIKAVQGFELSDTIKGIKLGRELKKDSPFRKLCVFLDDQDVLRAGGRIVHANGVSYDQKHPIIIPRGFVAELLVRFVHRSVGHLGKETVLAKLRDRFKIMGEVSLVKKIIHECIQCRKYQGKVIDQFMANLPSDRLLSDKPPFTNTGVDLFGPFQVVRGRASVVRFGAVFTCLSSRAVHLEVVFDKSTDSFIQALRRFIARRGQVQMMRSDNGTNFVGAERELKEMMMGLDQSMISSEMENKEINWIFNPPYAHHFGGAWEREIRTIRKVLAGLMSEQPRSFTDESLNTLLCEVEAIMNSKPLTPSSSDPTDLEAITPNHLLLQRSGSTFPPGLFQESDLYAKRRWKQVQYLANLFWTRWKREYLSTLMKRQRWNKIKRNVSVGDLVLLLMENTPRCRWPLARVLHVFPDQDGYVRKVRVKTTTGEYLRPISQLVMLLESV